MNYNNNVFCNQRESNVFSKNGESILNNKTITNSLSQEYNNNYQFMVSRERISRKKVFPQLSYGTNAYLPTYFTNRYVPICEVSEQKYKVRKKLFLDKIWEKDDLGINDYTGRYRRGEISAKVLSKVRDSEPDQYSLKGIDKLYPSNVNIAENWRGLIRKFSVIDKGKYIRNGPYHYPFFSKSFK